MAALRLPPFPQPLLLLCCTYVTVLGSSGLGSAPMPSHVPLLPDAYLSSHVLHATRLQSPAHNPATPQELDSLTRGPATPSALRHMGPDAPCGHHLPPHPAHALGRHPAVALPLLGATWPADCAIAAPLLPRACGDAQGPRHVAAAATGAGEEAKASAMNLNHEEHQQQVLGVSDSVLPPGPQQPSLAPPAAPGPPAAPAPGLLLRTALLPAHRVVLAARCDYFAALCSDRWELPEQDGDGDSDGDGDDEELHHGWGAGAGGGGGGRLGEGDDVMRRGLEGTHSGEGGSSAGEGPRAGGGRVRFLKAAVERGGVGGGGEGGGRAGGGGAGAGGGRTVAARVKVLRVPGCDADAAAVVVEYMVGTLTRSNGSSSSNCNMMGSCGSLPGSGVGLGVQPLRAAQPLPLLECVWAPVWGGHTSSGAAPDKRADEEGGVGGRGVVVGALACAGGGDAHAGSWGPETSTGAGDPGAGAGPCAVCEELRLLVRVMLVREREGIGWELADGVCGRGVLVDWGTLRTVLVWQLHCGLWQGG